MDLVSKERRLIRIVYVFGVLLAMAALALALLWLLQRRLIYLPFPDHVPAAASLLPTAQEVTLPTEDGPRLGAWYVPASRTAAASPEQAAASGPTVIVFNGNAGNRADRVPLARALSENGLSVLLFDYRGYGGNEGSPTEEGLRADALAASRYLATRHDVDPGRVVYFGESLGAAVALSIAEEAPPAALVLRSPFTSLADVARVHYPYLPVRLLLRERYPSLARVRAVDVPVLVVAANNDEIVPFEQSRRLYEAARAPKHLAVIPGAGHNDPELVAGPRLVGEVVSFLCRTVDRPCPRP